MTRRHSRQVSIALLAAAVSTVSFFPGTADATTKTWIPTGGGNYYANANWSPSGEPGAADDALFDLDSTYSVSFTGLLAPDPTHLQLIVREDKPTFNLQGRTYTVTQPNTVTDPSIIVGGLSHGVGGGQSALTIQNGTLDGVSAAIGSPGGILPGNGAGTLNVTTGATLSLSGLMLIGADDDESGFVNISNSSGATMNTAYIGFAAGGKGTLNVGPNASLASPFVYVGNGGTGTMNLTGSGQVFTSQEAVIGGSVGAVGNVLVDGGSSVWTITGPSFRIGSAGSGSLTVQNTAFVNGPNPTIGDGTGSTGSALVTGTLSAWRGVGSSASIGRFGTGSLTVAAGGSVSMGGGVSLGRQAGSNGNLTITGSGSRYGGFNLLVGDSGNGSLSITAGGVAALNTNTTLGSQSNGRGIAIVDGAGSRLETDVTLYVGDAGRGTLNISNGGVATTTFASIGSSINSVGAGTVTVTGPGASLISTSSLSIGAGAGLSGRMNIDSGGSVNVGGQLLLGSHGTIAINGGNLSAGSLTHFGTFDQIGGTSSIGPVDGTSTITLGGAGSFTADHVRIDTLVVGGNGVAKIRANGTDSGTSVVKNLAILGTANAWQGKVDLTDNDLVIDYSLSSPMASVRDQLRTARNNGAWNGNGITSSAAQSQPQHATTLGVLESADFHAAHGAAATFSGQSVDDNSVLVKYTWYGDADLNGTVNFDDYSRIDAGFSSGGADWFHGDFNYDGTVNFDDYSLIDLAFNAQSGTLTRAMSYLEGGDRSDDGMNSPALGMIERHFDQFGQAYATSFLNAVPEPSRLALIGTISPLGRSRRRSR